MGLSWSLTRITAYFMQMLFFSPFPIKLHLLAGFLSQMKKRREWNVDIFPLQAQQVFLCYMERLIQQMLLYNLHPFKCGLTGKNTTPLSHKSHWNVLRGCAAMVDCSQEVF